MLQALLLSRDQDVLRVMRRALDTMSIRVDLAVSPEQALTSLQKQKFDAVVVDVDDVTHGSTVISKLRGGKSNQRSIVFAVTNGGTSVKAAFEMGANFVLDKPLSVDRATRSLRAAHGLIMRERRRYFRAPVHLTAELSSGKIHNTLVSVTNISEGGLALKMEPTPATQGMAAIRLRLPGTSRTVELKGEFVSSQDRAGTVGVRFMALPPSVKTELDAWINKQIEATPASSPAAGKR